MHPGHGRGVRDAVLEAQRDAGACYWVAVLAIGQRQAAVLVSTAPQSGGGLQEVVCQRDQKWHSYTCTLGFWVMGMWPDGYGGSDINSVDRSHGRPRGSERNEFLVAADDYGKV